MINIGYQPINNRQKHSNGKQQHFLLFHKKYPSIIKLTFSSPEPLVSLSRLMVKVSIDFSLLWDNISVINLFKFSKLTVASIFNFISCFSWLVWERLISTMLALLIVRKFLSAIFF